MVSFPSADYSTPSGSGCYLLGCYPLSTRGRGEVNGLIDMRDMIYLSIRAFSLPLPPKQAPCLIPLQTLQSAGGNAQIRLTSISQVVRIL